MYGTMFRIRPKKGKQQAVVDLFNEWEKDRRPKVKGALAGYLFKPDNSTGELDGVAVFSSRETYRANADDPAQDKWYRKLRDLLEADPKWNDGEVLAGSK